MKVKICGIKTVEDGLLAAELGAWAVGFVFHPPSPRYIPPEEAAIIASGLPPEVLRVGVFVNLSLGALARTAAIVGIDMVQLHGPEAPHLYEAAGLPIIKAVSLPQGSTRAALPAFDEVTAILIDGAAPGTGSRADWNAAGRLATTWPLILSGGLRPANVAAAIAAVGPMAVDVASGVERSPGIKDATLMRQFFEAAATESGMTL